MEETKAWTILSAKSINTISLAKADPWGGYIFGRKFSASDTCYHGLNFQVCLVHKNQLGGRVKLSLVYQLTTAIKGQRYTSFRVDLVLGQFAALTSWPKPCNTSFLFVFDTNTKKKLSTKEIRSIS